MLNLKRILVECAAAVTLAMTAPGFASAASRVADFPNRHNDTDFKIAWKTTNNANNIVVSGLYKNIHYTYMDDVEVRVALHNQQDKVLAYSADAPTPQLMDSDTNRPFSVTLKNVTPAPGDTLEFMVRYRVVEGGTDNYNWLTTFTADAVTGTPIEPKPKPAEW